MNRESTSFRGRAERSFRYRNLAILAALPMLLSVLPGCEVVLFYYLLEQDDNAWSSVGEVSCDREGLRADGDLVIPILQPQDTQKTEEICSWWQLDFNDDSYRACCSGDCCEWGVGAWGTDPEDLSGDGEWCRWSGMCEVGLSCFPLPPGQDDGCPDGEAPGPNGCEPAAEALESGECRLSRLGEDCDGQHACEEPMYCSGSTMTGQCRLHVAVEGEGCLPAEVEPCLAPMQCTCQNKKECRCWDGSKGDPCEEGSCQVGLSCIAAAGDGTGKTICVEGKKGDPCKTGTCKAGLACMPTGGAGGTVAYLCVAGEFGDPCYDSSGCEPGMECIDVQLGGVGNCGIVLGQNAPCAPGSAFQICGSGMVCNTALPTPTCQPPGGEGDPCALDEHCAVGLMCAEGVGICSPGTAGSVCAVTTDCLAGSVCMEGADGLRCRTYVQEGEECDPENPFLRCIPGLACVPGYGGALCLAPGKDGTPCQSDLECLPGSRCVLSMHKCYDGHDGDVCLGGADCAEGFSCVGCATDGLCEEGGGKCYNGNTWDLCYEDADCQEGYLCNPDEQACFSGSHGLSCTSTDQCGPGLICIPAAESGLCFEYLAQGDLCGPTAPPFTACSKGLVCNDALEPPACALPGGEGTGCTSVKHCAEGFFCSAADSKCHDGSEGVSCTGPDECAPGLVCSAADAKCHDGGADDPCVGPEDCTAGLLCSSADAKCHQGGAGDPCVGPEDCTAGLLCSSADAKCHHGGAGDPCASDTDCTTGTCSEQGVCGE